MPKEEQKERYVEGSVATQTAPVVLDTSKKEGEDRILSNEAILAKILNKLEVIEKAVLG